MGPKEDFDEEKLHTLVDQALIATADNVVTEDDDSPTDDSSSPRAATIEATPLGFADTRLLERFAELLPGTMHQADIQVLLGELRDTLYAGIELGDLRSLHGFSRQCRKCPEAKDRASLPLGNVADPDIVFVSEGLPMYDDSYGFLTSALKGAGFEPGRICITGATRCPFGRAPESDELARCSSSYLYSELQLLAPKLIVPMGAGATNSLLSTSDVKITQESGKIYWLGPWAVMPVLSPAFALKRGREEAFVSDMVRAHHFCYG